jgi:hypothetical protein
VSNTLVADNGGGTGGNGILLFPSGSATAVFNRVEVNNNSFGIVVTGSNSAGTNTVNATVSDSVAAGNGLGFFSQTASGQAPTSLMVFHSVAANNLTGVEAETSGATLRLANSTVTGNANGWVASGGAVLSDGDNTIEGNEANQGAPTTYARK